MKKAILICALILSLVLCSCNMGVIGAYAFTHVYVETYKTEGRCFDVKMWTDSSSGVEVLTEDGVSMFLSEGTYILVSDNDGCPFCCEVEE